MQVTFLHPRDSTILEADVDQNTTGERCIRGLLDDKFIDPAPSGRPYGLQVSRTQRQVLPSMTMQQAGVVGGDHLPVLQEEQGA